MLLSVLRTWDVYPGSGSPSKNLSTVPNLSEKWSGMFIPDPGVIKAQDPRFRILYSRAGSAILVALDVIFSSKTLPSNNEICLVSVQE
jgi:hypothetical protein